MAAFVMGIFENTNTAKPAVEDLKKAGYTENEISVLVKDSKAVGLEPNGTDDNAVGKGVASGATTGGVLGALGGLLIGLGMIAIPGVGPILGAGPLLAALGLTGAAASTATGAVAGAATGAVAGGLIGAFTKAGIPQEKAELYARRLDEGAVILAVATDRLASTANNILARHGATEVTMFAA